MFGNRGERLAASTQTDWLERKTLDIVFGSASESNAWMYAEAFGEHFWKTKARRRIDNGKTGSRMDSEKLFTAGKKRFELTDKL